MKENVKLEQISLNDEQALIQVLDIIRYDKKLYETFGGDGNTISRILNACYIAFIKNLNQVAGFVMIVYNDRTNKHEVDMGLLTKFRGNGYGTVALSLLKQILLKNQIEVEIQVQNINFRAIQTLLKNELILLRKDETYSYYGLKHNKTKSI